MHPGADRQGGPHRSRRSLPAAALALAVALATAGCGAAAGGGNGGVAGSTAPLVTGEQVVTECFHAYFYNGILPKASAQTNCRSCVVDQLRRLGIQPASGENVLDMLTGDRLSNADIQSLQTSCDISDANTQ